MSFSWPRIPQTDPPRSPRETLPTMYDLPSEDPDEPGLPDVFHDLQPQLLSATLRLSNYSADQIFTGTDLNLYYYVRRPLWQKRPDWFLVLGVPRLYDEVDLRSSYVMWQEGAAPTVVVELLSPGTEKEDLGPFAEAIPSQEAAGEEAILEEAIAPENSNGQSDDQITTSPSNGLLNRIKPPGKWEVYESILRVPFYLVFSRYTRQLRFFRLVGDTYQEQPLDAANPRAWISPLNLGIGIWYGEYEGVTHHWIRWYDAEGNWILTDTEQLELERQRVEQERERAEQERKRAEQERERAEQERQRAERLAERLRQAGIDFDDT